MKKFWQCLFLFGLIGALFASCFSCRIASTAWNVPILMYHNLTNDPNAVSSVTITGERFREDMTYLQQNHYTPLLSSDLIAIRNGEKAMPAHPVMITFDDGYRSNYDIAYPILKATGMKAVISLIAHNICANDADGSSRVFLTWAEASEMADSGIVELGSHTYDLHNPNCGGQLSPDGINGVMRRRGESHKAYNLRVGEDLRQSIRLIAENTSQKQVLFFAYPFGAADRWMTPLLKQNGIAVSVLTMPGTKSIASGLTNLPRYGIHMEQPLSAVLPGFRQKSDAADQF